MPILAFFVFKESIINIIKLLSEAKKYKNTNFALQKAKKIIQCK
jgi:hypothetical protein